MKKNVIWWIGVKNEQYAEKYGGWEWMDISKKTWEYWCKKNDVLFVPFEKPIEKDLTRFRINWQKAIFVFDELERRDIEYDQICQIDCTHMIKWDAPNFFNLTNHELTAWRDMDNLRWIKESVNGYKNFFGGFELDTTIYTSSSPMIFNKKHKEVFTSLKEFYYENIDTLLKLQDELVKKGTEQTPLNYWLQMNNVKIKTDLPLSYKLTHMHRKEVLGHNWQLNEDTTPFFIKYGYDWVFTGFPKDQRTGIMKQTWDMVKHNYTFDDTELLLNSVRHKNTFKNATSRKFKSDLIDFFKDDKYRDMTAVELGGCQGDTTKILGSLFKEVHSVDRSESNVEEIVRRCGDNVHSKVMDVTNDEWDFPKADVVFVDASHDYPQVAIDIQKSIDYFNNPIIILDDYGNPNNKNIRNSIDLKVNEGKIKIDTLIGEDVGYKTKSGWEMVDREGVICTT